MGINISGLQNIEKRLEKLSDIKRDLKPILNTIGNMIQNSIEDSFTDEISPFGQRWKPLCKQTLNLKLKKGKSENILRNDGNLAENWHLILKDNSVSVSNNSQAKNGFKYGLTHQFGAKIKKGIFIQSRPFLPINQGRLEPNLLNNIEELLIKLCKE